MKKLIIAISILLTTTCLSLAQKAHDVLEDGIPIGEKENIFLKVSENILKYYIGETPTRPVTMEDSIIFLVKNTSINIYLKPLNPLNFSYKTENKLIIDQIDADAANALKSITDLASNFGKKPDGSGIEMIMEEKKADKIMCSIDSLQYKFDKIKVTLKFDKKDSINEVFNSLKKMTFSDEDETKKSLSDIKIVINDLETYFKSIDKSIRDLRADIKKYECTDPSINPFIVKYVFDKLATELQNVKDEQYKRMKNLNKSYNLVLTAQKQASEDKDGLKWCVFLDEIPAPKGKISIYTVTIFTSGYRLSNSDDKEVEKNEIIVDDTKQKIKNTLRIRRFQRFVPEVSAGIAYTNLSFPKFGTVVDTATGKQYVTNAGNDIIKRINITAMLNYNYYIPNSPIHPFIQLGVGANVDFPTLLLGGGFRFNANGKGRLALATGIASTWIKTLDKLQVGSEVSGSADLEKDFKYQFATPKMYFGIQYNF